MSSVSQYVNTLSPEVEARIRGDIELCSKCLQTAEEAEFPNHEVRIKADEKCYAAMFRAMQGWPKNTGFPRLDEQIAGQRAAVSWGIKRNRAFAIPSLDIRDDEKCVKEARSKSTPEERHAGVRTCSAALLT